MNFTRLYTKRNVIMYALLFVAFIFIVLPLMDRQMENEIGEAISPDVLVLYDSGDLFEMGELYGRQGRLMYVFQRATWDLAFPLVYGSFALAAIGYSINNGKILSRFKFMTAFPVIAVGLDFLENIFASIYFLRFPNSAVFFGIMTPIMTMFKWLFVSITFMLVLTLLIWVFFDSKRKKT